MANETEVQPARVYVDAQNKRVPADSPNAARILSQEDYDALAKDAKTEAKAVPAAPENKAVSGPAERKSGK